MIEYAQTYIGDCTHAECDRVAAIRVHGDWVLCGLHHEMHLLTEERNEIDLTLEFIKVWRSQAQAHGLYFIQLSFDRAVDDFAERGEAITERREALDMIEQESTANHDLRLERGKRNIKYPTTFARTLSWLSHYLGEDWAQFAADMTDTAGDQYGDAAREWLHKTLLENAGLEPPAGFMSDLASGLGLDGRQKTKLAMAYTFGK